MTGYRLRTMLASPRKAKLELGGSARGAAHGDATGTNPWKDRGRARSGGVGGLVDRTARARLLLRLSALPARRSRQHLLRRRLELLLFRHRPVLRQGFVQYRRVGLHGAD